MCLSNTNAPDGNKDQIGYFKYKGHMVVTRSLTLVSFERVSVLGLHAKYEAKILEMKVKGHGHKVFEVSTERVSLV